MPAVGLPDDAAAGFQGAQSFHDGLFAGTHGGAELLEAPRALVEGGEEAFFEGYSDGRSGVGLMDLQVQRVLSEGEGEGWERGGGAVFGGEDEFLSAATQIEVRVTPAMVSSALCGVRVPDPWQRPEIRQRYAT
ncbi:MAG: hypothetical protein GEU28_11700 [Dehalococcoidia bacterium]|nr:hypothetical protein [Dehalococcoidia bacterium]